MKMHESMNDKALRQISLASYHVGETESLPQLQARVSLGKISSLQGW